MDDLRATVNELSTNPTPDRYRAQSEALIRGRKVFEPAAVGNELRVALGLAHDQARGDMERVAL